MKNIFEWVPHTKERARTRTIDSAKKLAADNETMAAAISRLRKAGLGKDGPDPNVVKKLEGDIDARSLKVQILNKVAQRRMG